MIGELETKQLEWKIPKFTSLLDGTYKSSPFTYRNQLWHLRFIMQEKSLGFQIPQRAYADIDCETQSPCPDVIVSFSVKKSDGSLTMTQTLDKNRFNFVYPLYFIDVSILMKDKISLLPSDILTIVCNFEYGINLNGEETIIAPAQSETSLNENSAIETLEPVILAETNVLSKNFKDLFFNGECCDAVLHVQDKEFKAHRAVLIARSSVFAAMFKNDTSEKQTGFINVLDCDANTFQQFLEYLYSGKLEGISFDDAAHLYRTSDKYDVKELKTFCTKYMMQNLTVDNVCDVVILADEYDETELLSAAQKFFNENGKEIVKSSEWENLLNMNYRLANKLIIENFESKG